MDPATLIENTRKPAVVDSISKTISLSLLSPPKQSCPLCGFHDTRHFITGFDRVFPRALNFNYVQCLACEMVFIHPPPTRDTLIRYYEKGYEPHLPVNCRKIIRKLSKPLNRFVVQYYFKPFLKKSSSSMAFRYQLGKLLSRFVMKNALPPHGNMRLLDVGCGSGAWLYLHRCLGWICEGVEISEDACTEARDIGLNVFQGTLDELPSQKRYDVITMNHVIEHVVDPLRTLRQAKSLMAPDGLICIRLPNLDSYGFRRFGNCWFPLEPPRHLHQFSKNTIRLLAEKAGLKVRSLTTHSQPGYLWKSFLYEKYLGRNFQTINRMEIRTRRIQICRQKDRQHTMIKKAYKKAIGVVARWMAIKGKGETMHLVLEASDSGFRMGQNETVS